MIGWLAGVDWQATGVLLIGVWQAIKEFRLRKEKKRAAQSPPNRKRPPTLPPVNVR